MVIVAFPPGEKYAANYTTLDQYDYGQILRIQGLKLPKTVEVHFSTQETGGTSITRVGVTKDGVTDVLIPDSVLENGDTTQNYSIFAFVYITDATSGKTEYRARLEVKARPKPEVPGGNDNPDVFRDAVLAVRESALKAEEDAKKTTEDRKAVEHAVESVKDITEQVARVEELSRNAQEAATQTQNAAQGIITDREQINTNKEGVAQLKEDLEQLKQNGTGTGTGLSTEAINKLDEIGNHIPFASATGGTLWDELIVLLRNGSSGDDSGSGGDTTATPTSISATYTGGEVTTGTALSDLTGITVTATYSDGTTKTVTGYTLSGEILEGENTITVSYSGLTNTFTVTGIVESGGGDTTAELVTDGLVSYFDFRTCEYNNAGSGGSTLIQPTQGSGQLFTWSNNAVTEQSADYGVRVSRGFMYAENGGTNQSECGESFTWVFNSYLTSLSSPMFSTDYGALSNMKKINYEPRYNTSSSTQKVAKEGCGNRKENGYDLLFIVVDKNICKLYFGNELIKEIDGNTIEGFVSWYSKLLINILGGINSGYMSQLAIYNKALSDVEITEMQEYLKDLEVA